MTILEWFHQINRHNGTVLTEAMMRVNRNTLSEHYLTCVVIVSIVEWAGVKCVQPSGWKELRVKNT